MLSFEGQFTLANGVGNFHKSKKVSKDFQGFEDKRIGFQFSEISGEQFAPPFLSFVGHHIITVDRGAFLTERRVLVVVRFP